MSRSKEGTLILLPLEKANLQPTTLFNRKENQLDKVLIEFTLNNPNRKNIDVIRLSSSKNENNNERTNCKENCSNVTESQSNYTTNESFKCCNDETLLPRLCLL